MSFLDTIKGRIGRETYSRLEDAAEKEVALAMQMPLRDQYGQEMFYEPRLLLGDLLAECEAFEQLGLKILPIDAVAVLFRCKLLRATSTEEEYRQRHGGFAHAHEFHALIRWTERTDSMDVLINRYFTKLETEIRERTLLTHINSFDSSRPDKTDQYPQGFFDDLFASLHLPFVCFFEGDPLVEKYERIEPGLLSYDLDEAKQFFCAPSIGYTVSGSNAYCHWYSIMWLRAFLNMLRIAVYIHPGQRDFGRKDVQMVGPSFPVFLGQRAQGVLKFDEDKKASWAKIPDGCLFLSFGYRGLSKMWLDRRTFPHIRAFMLAHEKIFACLKNPWNVRSIADVAPALDILSSATQIPDVGAKILLVYCCLEHLFVPENTRRDNTKYIVGGMNALCPRLIPWFNQLYEQRCAYAHKGFVLKNDKTMALLADSMKNVMTLLIAKLSVQ